MSNQQIFTPSLQEEEALIRRIQEEWTLSHDTPHPWEVIPPHSLALALC